MEQQKEKNSTALTLKNRSALNINGISDIINSDENAVYLNTLDGALLIEGSELQANQAYKSGLSYLGKPIDFKLCNLLGLPISEERRYKPYFGEKCQTCGMKPICNGCTRCGKCEP